MESGERGMWSPGIRCALAGALGLAAVAMAVASPARALDVVLADVAPDRVERQRHFIRGELPLPGTPDLDKLDERLKAQKLAVGRAIYIRIFKAESELELWLQNEGGTFSRLATYPICHWTGGIGPKLKEGDKQSPEGFYSVGVRQTRLVGRWRRAFNLGFPNLHDQLLSRTGSYILIHGGCSSVGCFAMTDPVQNEIYALANAALAGGQERFQVHIFPFRMTDENLARYMDHDWAHTWADLKPAYDSFERTRVPPKVVLCGVRYKVADGLAGETGGSEQRMPILKPVSTDGLPQDPTAVLDGDGQWLPPPCELEDEARRKAAYTIAATTTSAVATAAAGQVDAVQASPLPVSAGVTEPTLDGRKTGRVPQTLKASRRASRAGSAGDAVEAGGASPTGDGFGSATFRAKDRVSAHGG